MKNKKLVAKLQTDFSLANSEAEATALALKEKAQLVGMSGFHSTSGVRFCFGVRGWFVVLGLGRREERSDCLPQRFGLLELQRYSFPVVASHDVGTATNTSGSI
jgi:hypothetical protein